MKKVKMIIFTLIIALLIPTSAFASAEGPQYGAGEWDTILGSTYTLAASTVKTSRVVNSGGGDVRLCITGVDAGNSISLELYSDDPIFDNRITGYSLTNGNSSGELGRNCSPPIDVRPFKDGTYAELYLKMRSRDYLDTVYIEIQD